MDFLHSIENLGFSTWIRESPSVWAYPSVITLHTFGLAFLVGLNAAVDLRIVGFSERLPLYPMKGFFPVMWVAFFVNAGSGIILLMADASTMLTNPVFYIKMGCMVLAMANLRLIGRMLFRDPEAAKRPVPLAGKILACTSLALWMGAITAGRLTAYIGSSASVR